MRTLAVMVVWIIVCSTSVTGQSRFQIQPEFLRKYKKITPCTFSLKDSPEVKGKLNVPFDLKNLPNTDLVGQAFHQNPQGQAKLKDPAAMPVLRPQGRYNMPVYQPDTTVQFTLLIKDYKKPQNKEPR